MEGEGAARLREELFGEAWGGLEGRIQVCVLYFVLSGWMMLTWCQDVLRRVNGNTLDEVSAFVKRAGEEAR